MRATRKKKRIRRLADPESFAKPVKKRQLKSQQQLFKVFFHVSKGLDMLWKSEND